MTCALKITRLARRPHQWSSHAVLLPPTPDSESLISHVGHALCKPCSASLGSSCHLCRSWFNRDRIVKLHVDYGRENAETGPAAEVAKEMEGRAAEVSSLQDIPAVRTEIELIMEWLGPQSPGKVSLILGGVRLRYAYSCVA